MSLLFKMVSFTTPHPNRLDEADIFFVFLTTPFSSLRICFLPRLLISRLMSGRMPTAMYLENISSAFKKRQFFGSDRYVFEKGGNLPIFRIKSHPPSKASNFTGFFGYILFCFLNYKNYPKSNSIFLFGFWGFRG